MAQQKIRVVFMGTPQAAVLPLQVLVTHREFEVMGVITQEDKPVGRKQIMTPPPVKQAALELGLTVLQPSKIQNNSQLFKLLKGLQADVFVVVAYGKILPEEILYLPRFGCVNIHFSLLPKYRGASPVEEALLHGDTQTGVAFMKMARGMDTGDILLMQRVQIEPSDTSLILREKLVSVASRQLPFILKDLVDGLLQPIPQKEEVATYCHKIQKEDGLLDFTQLSADEIMNKFRAYTPWPSVFFIENGKRVKITQLKKDENETGLRPGQKKIIDHKVAVGTSRGVVFIEKLQVEGKKEMTASEFLKGNIHFFADLV